MGTIEQTLIIIILISLLLIWIIYTYNAFQTYIIRINEVEANIDSILRKRFDLLSKAEEMYKSLFPDKKNIFKDLKSLKEEKLSNFDLDRKLYPIIHELEGLKIEEPTINQNESFNKLLLNLHETELEMNAYRKYYNDWITEYNKRVKTFPSNIVALFIRMKVKPYFDQKDQYDDDINDFKL